MSLTRRGFIRGILACAAAPAIVRAESLMRVRGLIVPRRALYTLQFPALFEFAALRELELTVLAGDTFVRSMHSPALASVLKVGHEI